MKVTSPSGNFFLQGLVLMKEGKKPKANPSGEGSVASPRWHHPQGPSCPRRSAAGGREMGQDGGMGADEP